MSGVLAVFAHPDDESLLAGGSLAACAAAGYEVTIVSLTRGEEGPLADASITRERLGEMRESELRAAARELGAAAARCLGYPDGGLRDQPEERVLDELASLLAELDPEIVISFGPEGLYWHEDHLATHRFVRAALALQPGPRLYEATWPEGRMAELARDVRRRGLPVDLWGIEPDAFGAPAGSIDVTLDVGRFVEHKLRALRSHRTQLGPGHLLTEMPDELAREFLRTEYFIGPQPSGEGVLAGVVARAVGDR
jgi:LmbE family N-acetylglucosaminyl deacetylase